MRDACGRIVARDGVSYEYRHGKVVAQGGPFGRRTFTYDPAGQLIARRDADGRSWRWVYDACGRRVEQVSPDGTDRYRYDAAGRLLEVVRHGPRSAVTLYRYDSAGRRTHEIHGELGRLRSTRYRWDELGRLREVRRRESGGPDSVTRIELDQAGGLLSVHGDLDGLEWLHFRTLDVATGMFLSPDPLPGVPGTPVVANPYHYAANDPVGLRDPFGLAPLTDADLEAMREAAGRPAWQKAYDSTLDLVDDPVSWAADHWETVAAAGLVVVGGVLVATGVGAPIGAGILVGASMAFASQVALTGEVDQRSLLVSTAAGAVGGGVGGATSGLAVTSQVAVGAGTDMALSAGAQYATTGTVDPHQVLWDGVIGASTGGVGAKLPWAPEPIPARLPARRVQRLPRRVPHRSRRGWLRRRAAGHPGQLDDRSPASDRAAAGRAGSGRLRPRGRRRSVLRGRQGDRHEASGRAATDGADAREARRGAGAGRAPGPALGPRTPEGVLHGVPGHRRARRARSVQVDVVSWTWPTCSKRSSSRPRRRGRSRCTGCGWWGWPGRPSS